MKIRTLLLICTLLLLVILFTACDAAPATITETAEIAETSTPTFPTAKVSPTTSPARNSKPEHLGSQGFHAGLACESCHKTSSRADTLSTCDSCHNQPANHAAKFSIACSVCHTPAGWSPAHFDHNSVTFKLVGSHAGLPCSGCHKNDVYKGTVPDCASCHAGASPHAGSYSTECTGCHTISSWKPVTFNHNLSSFKLEYSHANAACSSCHPNDIYKGTSTACSSCHAALSPHPNSYGSECDQCHSPSGWGQASFSHTVVGNDDCMDCHEENQPSGHFNKQCSTCHDTDGWLPASFSHDFNMDHGGANGECSVCHPSGPPETKCDTCHENEDDD